MLVNCFIFLCCLKCGSGRCIILSCLCATVCPISLPWLLCVWILIGPVKGQLPLQLCLYPHSASCGTADTWSWHFPYACWRDDGANTAGKAHGVKSQEYSGTWKGWWEEDGARYKVPAGEVLTAEVAAAQVCALQSTAAGTIGWYRDLF